MFKKILVPLDGSDLAAKILPQVADIAKPMEAEVTLLTIGVSQLSGFAGEFIASGYTDVFAKIRAETESSLAKTGNHLKSKGVNTAWIYREGVDPAREILLYAERNGFDMIAMATHGRGAVAWILGSVAEKVVTHATVPVLLLRVMEAGRPVVKEPGSDTE